MGVKVKVDTTDFVAGGIAFVFAMVLASVMIFALALVRAIAVSYLWTWFVVPLGVVPITLAWAFGLTLLYSVILARPDTMKSEKGNKAVLSSSASKLFVQPLFALAMGWCVYKLFM